MATAALALCSAAWEGKAGYVVFSVRDHRKAPGEQGYWKDISFEWPADKPKVESFLEKAERAAQDVYWSPAIYKSSRRRKGDVQPTDLLWADLDEADPRTFEKRLQPFAWWETSPGRFQAIWKLTDTVSPEVQTHINKRLSYHVGADKGGWDLTQVLRLPGTYNHKYDDVKVSEPRMNGTHPIDVSGLEQTSGGGESQSKAPISESDLPSPGLLLRKIKLPAKAKQLLRAKPKNAVEGTRSETLWELECLLAESGCTVEEIVALTRASVWNKFAGRHDELDRLVSEAQKAISHVSPAPTHAPDPVASEGDTTSAILADQEDEEVRGPVGWDTFDRDHQAIRWLVAELWGESEVGFISGPPKSYKSWLSLELAVSVATGTKFLNTFQASKANVLLIQEEDPKVVTQDRLTHIAASKDLIWANITGPSSVEMRYELPDDSLYIMSNQGFQITDEDWLEEVEQYVVDLGINLLILDPLMMMAEGMDEFKAFDMMSKVLKPLKRLRARTKCAICVVHHHGKNSEKTGAGAMYGTVALWAWEESALHLQPGGPGRVTAERFSKHSRLQPFTVEVPDIEEKGWTPTLYMGTPNQANDLLDILSSSPSGMTIDELREITSSSHDVLRRQLDKLEESGKVEQGQAPKLPGERGRRRIMWKLAKEG